MTLQETRWALAARDDGWMCAYCATPLLPPEAIEFFFQWEGQTVFEDHCHCGRCAEGDVCVLPAGWTARPDIPTPDRAEVDHVVPKSRGGSDDLDNLVLACKFCNCTKYNRTGDEFRAQRAARLAAA